MYQRRNCYSDDLYVNLQAHSAPVEVLKLNSASQGFRLLMAKILANIKAALGLNLLLAEVNVASSHP